MWYGNAVCLTNIATCLNSQKNHFSWVLLLSHLMQSVIWAFTIIGVCRPSFISQLYIKCSHIGCRLWNYCASWNQTMQESMMFVMSSTTFFISFWQRHAILVSDWPIYKKNLLWNECKWESNFAGMMFWKSSAEIPHFISIKQKTWLQHTTAISD